MMEECKVRRLMFGLLGIWSGLAGGFSLSSLAPRYYLTGVTYFGLAPYLTIASAETHSYLPPLLFILGV